MFVFFMFPCRITPNFIFRGFCMILKMPLKHLFLVLLLQFFLVSIQSTAENVFQPVFVKEKGVGLQMLPSLLETQPSHSHLDIQSFPYFGNGRCMGLKSTFPAVLSFLCVLLVPNRHLIQPRELTCVGPWQLRVVCVDEPQISLFCIFQPDVIELLSRY